MKIKLTFESHTNAREALRFLEKLRESHPVEIWYDGDRRSWIIEVKGR